MNVLALSQSLAELGRGQVKGSVAMYRLVDTWKSLGLIKGKEDPWRQHG